MSDSCCNTSHDSEKPSCACNAFSRWLPYLLLIAAAALYAYNFHTKSKYSKVAGIIRYQASQPFSQVFVVYRLEGRTTGIAKQVPPDLATNLMQSLATATPRPPFKGVLQGTECEIVVAHTNGTRSAFKAVRLDDDPLTLYIGTMLPENISGTNVLRLSTPAEVKNGGPILGQIIDEIIQIGANLPSDEVIREKALNQIKQAEETSTNDE